MAAAKAKSASSNSSPSADSEELVPSLVEKMATLQARRLADLELDELEKRFERIEIQEQEEGDVSQAAIEKNIKHGLEMLDTTIYARNLDFVYVDFVNRQNCNEYPTLKTTVSSVTIFNA